MLGRNDKSRTNSRRKDDQLLARSFSYIKGALNLFQYNMFSMTQHDTNSSCRITQLQHSALHEIFQLEI